MKRRDLLTKILALHFVGLYAVLVIFSGKFHTHHGEGLPNFILKKNAPSSLSVQKSGAATDCLVCQFNATTQLEVPTIFDLHLPEIQSFYSVSEKRAPEFVPNIFFDFYLRGPPAPFSI